MEKEIFYIDKISILERKEFKEKLIDICNKLNIDPNWLMIVMNSESGLNPKAVNKLGGATGLIQFMPDTARALGTTTEALRNMTATQQLDYVYKYFLPYKNKIKSAFDLYLVTFFPLGLGKPDTWVFQSSQLRPDIIAKYNPSMDLNKDNQITMLEFKKWFLNRVEEKYRDYILKKKLD